MRNKYYLIHVKNSGLDYEVIGEYTNKKTASDECKRLYRWRKAANGLREIEGSRERNRDKWFVTTSKDFKKDEDGGYIITDIVCNG